MTLGIAVPFPGGSILCADSRIGANDAASSGENEAALLSVTAGKRMFAITWAATDPRAGRMLASDIAGVACSASQYDVVAGIKRVMGDWFRSYGVAQVPSQQFIVAGSSTGEDAGRVLLCEPPSTVVETGGPCVVGTGARALTPWLKLLAPRSGQNLSLRSIALRLTYLTWLARRFESQSVGEDTEMIVLSNRGSFAYIDHREIRQAETIGEKVDALLLDMARQVLTTEIEQNPQTIAEEFLRGYFDVMEQNPQVFFPSLSYLEKASAGPQPVPIDVLPTGTHG
jgi:hypothetical protein